MWIMCMHTQQKVMEVECCPREDTVRDIHATEAAKIESLSNQQRELIACIEFRVCCLS